MIKAIYDLDMTPRRSLPIIINVSQNDDLGRTLVFNLFSSTGTWTAPDSATATLEGGKPDGKFFSFNCTYSKGTVTAIIQQQMTAVSGKVVCKIKVQSGNKVIESAPIYMMVDAAGIPDGADMSKSDINDAVASATQKIVEQVAGSIPKDYTALNKSVDELKSNLSDVEKALHSDYADMSFFVTGAISSSDGTINTQKTTQLASKLFRILDGETISVPSGFKLRVFNYSGRLDEENDTAQYYNGVKGWVENYTFDSSTEVYTLKRIEIYKSGSSDLNLEDLQGHVKTTISALLALEDVKAIREHVEKTIDGVIDLSKKVDSLIKVPEKISIYNAFDLSGIKHGYENGNIALVAEKGKIRKIRLLGDKTGDWDVSFALDALYRYEANTKISIKVTDGTNMLTLTQTNSTADTYKKYIYMVVDYNGTTVASVHLLTAKKKITRKDGVLYLELGDYEEPIILGEFGTAEVTVTIEAVESDENVYYIKNFESTLSGFTIPTYNLYIRDIDFAEDGAYIYLVYYVNAIARLSKMNKLTGSCETVTLKGMRADIDSHNSIAIALDNSGDLHVAGGCHASALVYFTGSASDISSVAKSTALSEASATYPEFVSDGTNLYFVCRSGTSGNSYDIAYKYESGTWTRTTSEYIDDGTSGNGGTCYFSPWELCSDGYFYAAFCWRNNATGVPGVGANMYVCVAKTQNFQRFYDFAGNILTLPMTISNTETCIVDAVPQNSGLLNQVGMGVMGSDGDPIVWYFKNDEYGNRNLYFAVYDNDSWIISKATNHIGKSIMQGVGTIDSLISRVKFAYGADYDNAVIFAMDYFGRSYTVEVDNKGQSNRNDVKIPEYEVGSEQICVSRKHGSFVTQSTQRTLFDKNLPQKGNGILTVFC